MLVNSRRIGQKTYLILPDGTEIVISVTDVDRGKVKIGFEAPPAVGIWREELVDEVRRERPR